MSNPLLSPSFMTQRERWLKDTMKSEMRQYAIKYGSHLLMNDPEIDEYGYDLTLEESFSYVPIQIKTKSLAATTSSWNIRCDFFRPSFGDQNDQRLNLRVNGQHIGFHGGGGGVVLQEFDENSAINSYDNIHYYFCDFFYILSIARGFWSSNQFTQQDATQLLENIAEMADSKRFSLPRRAFLPIISPTSILDFRLNIGRVSNHISIFMTSLGTLSNEASPLRMFRYDRSIRMPSCESVNFPTFRDDY